MIWLSLARVAGPPVLTAIIVASCTAQHFRLKIDNMELEWTAKVAKAEARAAEMIAQQHAITQEVSNEYQTKLASLSDRYDDARRRLQNQAAARRVPAVPDAASVPDAAASSHRLPDGSTPYQPEVIITLDLLQQADINTQKLMGLQSWIHRQQSAGSAQTDPPQSAQ